MLSNFRERADLTKIIRSILDSYPAGSGILRELVQNSDDARATSQTFILDQRTHPNNTLVDVELQNSQGPALLAINDTIFTEKDWHAIANLHSSSKTADESKIGKFGIGVRACYHITDNPHFLSDRSLVIFDPHERFSGERQGGFKLDFKTPDDHAAYADQLAAFADAIVPNADGDFNGTVVRLPLRTQDQAPQSTIKAEAVEPGAIRQLFKDFVEKELREVMLFLKHIRSITLKVIHPNGREEFLGGAELTDIDAAGIEKRRFARTIGARQESFLCTIAVTSHSEEVSRQTWRVVHRVCSTEETTRVLSDRVGYPAGSKLLHDKLFSHIGLAFPSDPSPADGLNGRLFTLLPLPIHTGFPVHLHAILALTSDRQSLRNFEEAGADPQSRERLLVSWNRTIFDKFLPETWCTLLNILVDNQETSDIWSAWPAATHANIGGSGYWSDILAHLLRRVVELDLPVFPAYPGNNVFIRLSSAFIASDQDEQTLQALAKVGIPIVKPPQHILTLLNSLATPTIRMLHSNRLRDALKGRIVQLGAASENEKDIILKYLVVFPGSLDNIIDLPLLPALSGPRPTFSESTKFCLVNQMEGEVFGDLRCNDHLVPLAVLDPAVSFVLTESVKTKANVTFFNHNHVTTYFLSSIYATFRTQDEIDGSTTDVASRIRWLVDFWRFMQQWLVRLPNQRKWLLLQKIERYHLLVTRRGTLRRLEQRAFHPIEETNADAIMDAWGLLSVPFLHPELAPHASAIRGMRDDLVLSPYHIHSLIEYIPPPAISKLDTMSAGYIRDHLVAAIQRSPPAKALETRAKEVYAKLPIFPLRVPDTTSSTNNSERVVGPVEGNVVFLRVDDTCPVPVLSNLTTFFDVTAPSGDLAKLLDSEAKDAALDERGVLELSIGQLTTQPTPIQNALLRRIVARLADLSAPSIKTLAATPFVPVVGSSEKLPPSKVIDPRSKLAPLYEGEKGKLPSGQWATERQLALLTPHIPFLQHLTPALVEERVAFLNKRKDKDEYKKAQLFLRLLIKSWGDIGAKLPAGCLDRAWMPINADTSLALPSECRDMGESPYLFDLVLYPVADRIRDAGLRRALGWGELSLDTLRQQLNLALNKREDQADRLLELITELARRQISEGDLTVLRDIVSHSLWIPTDDDNGNLAGTDLALLRSAEKMPGGRFKPVHHTLVKGVTRKFLVKMGCKADPSLTTLLNELELLVAPAASAGTNRIDQALRLLAEIATNDCTPEESARILVPGRDKLLHPLSETYYKDTHDDEFLLDAGHAAHSKISEDLARELGMQFASSLELGDDEEEDDMQMGEDFTKRVEGVLKEHDIQYALNEFLANAVDAHANTFSIIVDERVFDSEKVLAPKLAELQRRPSLFFHNDSTFSAEDLAGLRSVGQGGKRLNPDSIGRYGLGALGLFHFTDVVFLVTATYFLVLDPSGTYLPPRRGGKPRTSLLWTIERVARRYPDQLAAFEGVCDFSAGSISYPGTLFRLPLREASGPLSSNILRVSGCVNLLKEQYYGLAKDAMFFTRLQRVSASYRSPSSVLSSLWTVTAQRPPTEIFDEREILVLSTTLEGQVAVSNQRWLVARSILPIGQVPIEHHALISDLGLTQSRVGLVTRVALRLDSAAVTDLDNPHFLFSSLRLPVRTSLPVHVSAQFAISSDRRHVRFDPADQTGQRLPEVAFNIWILEKLVPPLLIFGLCLAAEAQVQARHPRDSFVSWPTKRDKGDEISTLVIRAFYALAVKSPEKLCLSVSGGLVAPAAALMANYKTPPDVLGLLTGLVKPTDFIDPPFAVRTMLADAMDSEAEHDQIRFVNSEYLREVLCPWTAQLVAHFNAARDETNVRIISAALCFLLEGKVSIADLPLLVLADGTLAAAGAITRYLHRGPIPPIFDKARFLDERIDVVTEELLLASPDANVKRFDADAVLSLLKEKVSVAPRVQHPPDVANWIVQFWACFGQLPGPPEAEKLKTLPLILTTDGQHISLQQSTRIDVLRRPVNHNELHDLILALGNIGFTFCTVPASAPDSLGGQPIARGFTPNAVLEAVRDLASPFADLSQDEVGHIANWVQLHLGTIVDSDLRSVVRSLPIWQARHNGEDVRRSMNDLKCLPHGVVASAFDEFVPRNSRFALAPASYALSTAMFWYPVVSALDSETMARLIVLPESLTQVYGPSSSVASYKTMLAEFLKMPGMGMISVPDGQMRLRDVGQLFDPSVDLFREALFSVRSQRFPHDGLIEQFSEQLRARGLRYQRSWPAFLLCATTVHEDLTQRHQDEAAVLSRARVVFEFYNNLLPGLAMADEHKWNALDALRFVPRLARRSNSSTYESDAYCGEMPLIVAPSQIIRPEFEQISWSQRALFAHPASADLLSLNSTLGVPKVAEVVNHLAVLALQVAPDHPRNSSLLSQLRATYKWLNDKKADAQPFLVARSAEPLFLNVDDADAENWDGQWKSAEQLQFDIPYDYPTLFQVRRFLQDYRQLVLAAGAGQHYTVAFTAAAPAQSDDHIRSKFNEMRLAGRRTDIKLLPENAEGAYDENTLRAHWSFLIATLPHLEMAESGWSEGAAGKDTYTFPGTYFGARAVLDFLYTGKIVATPEADGHMDFLRDLLELLQGADQWGMSELKDEIGSVIAKFGLLSSATYWNVFDEATKYNAASLLQYCNDFRLKNPRSVESRESEQMDIAEL